MAWYFAYGSNLDPRTFEGRRRMRPLEVRRARLDGYRLVFDLPAGRGKRGAANLATAAGANVWGVAYRITGRAARWLDLTEGVPLGSYRRIEIELALEDGGGLAAFTYQSPRGRADRKPSARYMGIILNGARHHGLDASYIRYLEGFELAGDERR